MQNTIKIQRLELHPIKDDSPNDLSDVIHFECSFCTDTVGMTHEIREICTTIGGGELHCPFCLRHNYHTRNSKHILGLSFRGIFAHYYYSLYKGRKRKLWLSQIEQMIDNHADAGTMNPAFAYNPKSLMWFIDFAKVGKGRRKIDIEKIRWTVMDVFNHLSADTYISDNEYTSLRDKLFDSVNKWYSNRYRPDGVKFVIPTPSFSRPKNVSTEMLKNFTRQNLVLIGGGMG